MSFYFLAGLSELHFVPCLLIMIVFMLHNETLGKRCIQLSITSTQLPHTRRFLSALQHYFYPYSGLVAAIVSPSFALAILLHTPPIFLLFALAQRGIEGLEDFKYVNPFSYALIGLIGNESEGAGTASMLALSLSLMGLC